MSDTTASSLTRSVEGTEVPAAGTYTLDVSHTTVGFVVKHLMVSKVRGSFKQFEGEIVIADDPSQSSVEVSVELASIDSRDEQRDAHLRSADFFNVDEHPTMTYRSTGVRHDGDNTWIVDGELTIAGTTKPLQLTVDFEGASRDPWGGTRIGFSARGELNREDYGMTWNAALETGGFVVGKKVTLELEAEAILQA